MADKEPRKRKKRKEGQKREENEDVPQQKETPHAHRPPVDDPTSHDVGHEPSIFAKSVFFILFSLLIVAVGVIFFTLHGVQRGPWDMSKDSLVQTQADEHPQELVPEVVEESTLTEEPLNLAVEGSNEDNPALNPDVLEDDLPDDQEVVSPSEMHPWAEHVPEEKPEQNFFSQMYEALGDELFEDDDNDDGHSDEDEIDEEVDGAHKDEETSQEFTEDSFFTAFFKDDEEIDASKEQGSLNSDSFEVIVEDVELPFLETLQELPEDLNLEAELEDDSELSSDLHEQVTNLKPNVPDFEKCDSGHLCEIPDEAQVHEPPMENLQPSVSSMIEDASQDLDSSEIFDSLGKMEETQSFLASPALQQEHVLNTLEVTEDSQYDFSEPDLLASEQQTVNVVTHADSTSPFTKAPEDIENIEWQKDIIDKEMSDDEKQDEDESVAKEVLAEMERKKMELNVVEDNVLASEEIEQSDSLNVPYENADVTNEYDFLFKEEIDEADRIVEKEPDESDFYFWRF